MTKHHYATGALQYSFALILSILFTEKLVRFIFFKFHCYFNQHKMSALAAFVMPLFLLFTTIFVKLNNKKKQRLKTKLSLLYPHITSPFGSLANVIRILLQSVYLITFNVTTKDAPSRNEHKKATARLINRVFRAIRYMDSKLTRRCKKLWLQLQLKLNNKTNVKPLQRVNNFNLWQNRILKFVFYFMFAFIILLFVTVPFSLEAQAIFISLILIVAYSLRRVGGQMATITMITLAVTTSTRYLWWRYTDTLNWGDPLALTLGIGLLLAETYAWLVLTLGFFQTINPLHRKPIPMDGDTSKWPTVDIYIPTYNEPLNVVKPTAIAAQSIDWPADKLNIYILDDGKRPEFAEMAKEIGVGYLDRPDNSHAKAGNMNHAMKYTDGEYIAIFDCDHIPARSFLQMTMGQFIKDEKVCLVQTPHHFFSADPFERNLDNHRQIPNENMLFYGLIQDGNDMWDATFFCGSCAVLKRKALDDIGGFAVETVTEDAHTALRMQRAGYRTAYINIPQAAGLATDSLSAHVGQRIRWARGMAQIFRLDNPLLGKGLSLVQRLCYTNAMLHFLSGIPRIVFLTAPLALIYLDAYIIYAPFIAIFLYIVPTLMQIKITNSRIQGKYRYSFWGEVYESVLV